MPRAKIFQLDRCSRRPLVRHLFCQQSRPSRENRPMFCISIYQESRRFALADMLNASRQCDLLELRLDKFARDPEVGEMLAARPKPVICCCRRPQDGGDWDGTEEDRQALLRQCVVAGADYVELEMDIADQIRRYGSTKRVVSYTNLRETPEDIADIYAEAQRKQPDVIKLVTRAQTPEEAWPLVQILARPAVPTVVVGLGPSSAMLTLLAKRIGAPWTYAALERGMEAYPGQLTVSALQAIYRHQDIGKATRFVGVLGSTERERLAAALLNTALIEAGLPTRCLPLEVGDLRLFRKVLEAVKLNSVLVDEDSSEKLREMIAQYQGSADRVRAVDLIAQKNEDWHGFLMRDRAVVACLNEVLKSKHGADNSIQGRTFLIAGVNRLAQAVAGRISKNGGIVIVTDRNRNAATLLAQDLQCRVVQFEALYTTLHDVLISALPEEVRSTGGLATPREKPIHVGYLKPGMCVVDLLARLQPSELLRQASKRSCLIVRPAEVLLEQVAQQAKLITGKEPTREMLKKTLAEVFQEEESEEEF